MSNLHQTGIVYKLYWNNSLHFYIGQTIKPKERYKKHVLLMSKGQHENERINRMFSKFGIPEFEIIDTITYEYLNELEQFYLDHVFSDKHCCNSVLLHLQQRDTNTPKIQKRK